MQRAGQEGLKVQVAVLSRFYMLAIPTHKKKFTIFSTRVKNIVNKCPVDWVVSVVELVSGTVTKAYATGVKPHGIDVSDDGEWLFV